MKAVIFKSDKNAKVYQVRSSINQGCYKEDELIMIVRTDEINKLLVDEQYERYAVEIR